MVHTRGILVCDHHAYVRDSERFPVLGLKNTLKKTLKKTQVMKYG